MNTTMQAETFRRQMPPSLASRPLNLPDAFSATLANGLGLVLIEDRRLPLISFRLAFRSGDANDPENLPGLSDMMSHLLSEGTETRTSRQIAEEIERLGATLSVGSTSDFSTVAASSLSIHLDDVLELLADVTCCPADPHPSAHSSIVIANEAITRPSPDSLSLLLMHTRLGATASPRLFMNPREHKGYTYGAYSDLDARRLSGTFRATAEVRPAVTGASLHEFFYELNHIRNDAVSDEEITNAKSYLSGVFPIRIETQDGLIDQLV